MGGAVGLAGAVLTNTVASPESITTAESKQYDVLNPTTVSKLAIHETQTHPSETIRSSAISSSLNILADSTVLEDKGSIVGNLLEKAIDNIDKQLEEDSNAQQQKAEEEARVKADVEAKQKAEAEAKLKAEAEAQRVKQEAEAKVSDCLVE